MRLIMDLEDPHTIPDDDEASQSDEEESAKRLDDLRLKELADQEAKDL